jgi:hypothetical protein
MAPLKRRRPKEMTYTTDELRKLQNYYGERAVDLLLKWGGAVASIGRPERRKVKATQFVFTPLASTPRFLTAGEWYLMGMFVCDVYGGVEAIPYKRTEVEIEIEEDEDEA